MKERLKRGAAALLALIMVLVGKRLCGGVG